MVNEKKKMIDILKGKMIEKGEILSLLLGIADLSYNYILDKYITR
jgi:hypothetical protein